MHQNSPFWAQKSKNLLGRGHSPSPDLSPWGGGHPLPTPYPRQRLRRLDTRAYGARPRPQGRLPKIRANLVLPPPHEPWPVRLCRSLK